jgi:hypothetical protein
MRQVGVQGRQDDLGVARDLDPTRALREVRERDAPDLDVVLGRHAQLRVRLDLLVSPPVLRAIRDEDRLVVIGLRPRRLVGGRPDTSGVPIAEIDERAPRVARRVLPPAGDREIAPSAVAAARMGRHDVVGAVREQLHLGHRRAGIVEDPQRGLPLRRLAAGSLDVLRDVRGQPRSGSRDPLLQERLRGAHLPVGHETTGHRAVVQQVVERHQAHALVVGHERTHDRGPFGPAEAGRRVVDRLVEPVAAEVAVPGERLEVPARRAGRHRKRQHGRVRRDDEIVDQAPLEAQPRDAEGPVLIHLPGVHGVVARLRDPPRNAAPRAVLDLACDGRLRRAVEQRIREGRQQQLGHQVLEHRAAPREQREVAVVVGQKTAEREPVILGQLLACDEKEAREARLRREQVVAARIAAARGDVVPDREEFA